MVVIICRWSLGGRGITGDAPNPWHKRAGEKGFGSKPTSI